MAKQILGLTHEQLVDKLVEVTKRSASTPRKRVVKPSRIWRLLAEALERYGAHDLHCSSDGCDCGFDAAVAFATCCTDAPITTEDVRRTEELANIHGWATER